MDLCAKRISSNSVLSCTGSHPNDNTSPMRQYLLVTKLAAAFWTRCSFFSWVAGSG